VEKGAEAVVVICEVLRAHDLAFAGGGDFVVGHPFPVLTRVGANFGGPLLEFGGFNEIVRRGTDDEEAVVVKVGDLRWY